MAKMSKRVLNVLARQMIPNVGTILAVILLLFAYRAWAAPQASPAAPNATPGVISYQGNLVGSSGQPVNGDVAMTFRLYNVPTNGTALWTEAHISGNAVPVSNGLFNVLLGSLTPISSTVWSNDPLYLGVFYQQERPTYDQTMAEMRDKSGGQFSLEKLIGKYRT